MTLITPRLILRPRGIDDGEKLGFVYHHTTEGIEVSLLDEIRTGHAMLMTKET